MFKEQQLHSFCEQNSEVPKRAQNPKLDLSLGLCFIEQKLDSRLSVVLHPTAFTQEKAIFHLRNGAQIFLFYQFLERILDLAILTSGFRTYHCSTTSCH